MGNAGTYRKASGLDFFVFFLNEDGFTAHEAALLCGQCSQMAFHRCVCITAALGTNGCDDGQEFLHHNGIAAAMTANRGVNVNGSGVARCKVTDFDQTLFHIAEDLAVAAHQRDIALTGCGKCAHSHADSDTAPVIEVHNLMVNNRVVTAVNAAASVPVCFPSSRKHKISPL